MTVSPVALFAAGGIVIGLLLLWQGIGGHRLATRIGDTSTSRIASLAAGEVRLHGVVEPAEVSLVSPLQSVPCVWYRASVERTDDDDDSTLFEDERGVGFRVRDDSGSIRVFPRGAVFDVPDAFDDRTGMIGDEPPGLAIRSGPLYGAGRTDLETAVEREAAIAALLTVRQPFASADGDLAAIGWSGPGRRRYREARIEPGDAVTVVGSALPFGYLPDPSGADAMTAVLDPGAAFGDPEVAADIAEARQAGLLTSPADAWGNAAIPGFGIGRPVREPELDPEADPVPLASPEEAARSASTFDLEPNALVVAFDAQSPLVIAAGSPAEATARQQQRFLVGLLGAVLAIGSAMAMAAALSGTLPQ